MYYTKIQRVSKRILAGSSAKSYPQLKLRANLEALTMLENYFIMKEL
jgi:hypothetical protein